MFEILGAKKWRTYKQPLEKQVLCFSSGTHHLEVLHKVFKNYQKKYFLAPYFIRERKIEVACALWSELAPRNASCTAIFKHKFSAQDYTFPK